ncbi:DCN1-like protein 2 isoform X4 [Trachypithecus francoisi]|uniref:DCN1-like protein 2 isoform X4 n=1 Tax=Trachypithecus francoisi TaxID=54180 RepID=UPI00141B00F6|nr:DCN1-like protein 2 isoform X4 [Trachypithecus francoisi]
MRGLGAAGRRRTPQGRAKALGEVGTRRSDGARAPVDPRAALSMPGVGVPAAGSRQCPGAQGRGSPRTRAERPSRLRRRPGPARRRRRGGDGSPCGTLWTRRSWSSCTAGTKVRGEGSKAGRMSAFVSGLRTALPGFFLVPGAISGLLLLLLPTFSCRMHFLPFQWGWDCDWWGRGGREKGSQRWSRTRPVPACSVQCLTLHSLSGNSCCWEAWCLGVNMSVNTVFFSSTSV